MASCRSAPNDAGYATPAALVFGLALALVAAALVGRSTMMLRQSKADLERMQVAYALDGAHLAAAATVVRAGDGGPYRWAFASDAGWVEALAEREDRKLTIAAASALSDEAFAAFGVRDAEALRQRLSAAENEAEMVEIAALDTAALWRACAGRLISVYGAQGSFEPSIPVEPRPGDDPAWRVAETWRLRLTTQAGWRDDRIVRFTGDAHHPVAVVTRQLSRSGRGDERCDEILAAL